MTDYDRKATLAVICAEMAEGKSLRSICARPDMPDKATVMRWLDEDASGTLRAMYGRAREALADEWFDERRDVAFDDADDPNNKRVKLDMLKWTASRLAPRRYGDRAIVAVGGDPDAPPIAIRSQDDAMIVAARQVAFLLAEAEVAQARIESHAEPAEGDHQP